MPLLPNLLNNGVWTCVRRSIYESLCAIDHRKRTRVRMSVNAPSVAERVRAQPGRCECSSDVIMDGQSVKTTELGGVQIRREPNPSRETQRSTAARRHQSAAAGVVLGLRDFLVTRGLRSPKAWARSSYIPTTRLLSGSIHRGAPKVLPTITTGKMKATSRL